MQCLANRYTPAILIFAATFLLIVTSGFIGCATQVGGAAMDIGQKNSSPEKNAIVGKVAPSPQDSKAFQNALAVAFADLKQAQAQRNPASTDIALNLRTTLLAELQNFSSFEVNVYPKLMSFSNQRSAAGTQVHLSDVEKFLFKISQPGHCEAATKMIPSLELKQCIRVEISPVKSSFRDKQVVRLYLSPTYRAYGLSYHEYDNLHGVTSKELKKVKWDPSEPLSSEMLALAKEIFPLDLPAHASNGLSQKDSRLKIQNQAPLLGTQGINSARLSISCEGKILRYKNAFGSQVNASWCKGDPWPAVVETDRYLAILMSPMNRKN